MISDDAVWKALADPTRRRLIELLERSPRTTGELAQAFPKLSRIAVTKHLSVLRAAGLLTVDRDGRRRWNRLERDPLRVADAWLARHVERRRDMMMRLKEVAEEREG
jgi:DNA-binding transcriptional ArsR family regulator